MISPPARNNWGHCVADEGFKRMHAAILGADIVSYSRPMGKYEVGIIQPLTECREIIVQTKQGQSDKP
jgi:hypothetical protein